MIDWNKYDSKNEFTIVEAACLLLEIEPTKEIENEPPVQVIEMVEKLKILAGMVDDKLRVLRQPIKREPGTVSRDYLLEIAPKVIKEPPFLFPEVRDKDILNGHERNTYLRLIAALLQAQKIDPTGKAVAPVIAKITEVSNYQPVSEKTIREKILPEINALKKRK